MTNRVTGADVVRNMGIRGHLDCKLMWGKEKNLMTPTFLVLVNEWIVQPLPEMEKTKKKQIVKIGIRDLLLNINFEISTRHPHRISSRKLNIPV